MSSKYFTVLLFLISLQLGCTREQCESSEIMVFISQCDSIENIKLSFNGEILFHEEDKEIACIGKHKLVSRHCVISDTLVVEAELNGFDTTVLYVDTIPEKILFSYIKAIEIYTEKDSALWYLD